jgi:succinyl-CoA synthetase alpha subunit
MSILIDKNTRTIIQGITGTEGSFHTRHMLDYGTQVVAGVTPGKGKSLFDERIPVYNSVVQAVKEHNATASVIFVPGRHAADAIMEAAEAGIELVVCITEGIPALDMLQAMEYLKYRKTRLIGPNCPGIISPGKSKLGIMPGFIHQPGRVGVVSRSGTLTYEAVNQLSLQGIGQSTCIGIGGDMILGTSFVDVLGLFENDSKTEAIVLIGEIGGSGEEEAARYIKSSMRKPVIAFIAGISAPSQRRMGHAGAIISGSQGTVASKIKALYDAGATICHNPAEIGLTTNRVLSGKIKS